MNREIMEYAIIGLTTKLNEIENSIFKGEKIIKNRTSGLFNDKSPKTTNEIRNIIKTKRIEFEELINKRTELEWELND